MLLGCTNVKGSEQGILGTAQILPSFLTAYGCGIFLLFLEIPAPVVTSYPNINPREHRRTCPKWESWCHHRCWQVCTAQGEVTLLMILISDPPRQVAAGL